MEIVTDQAPMSPKDASSILGAAVVAQYGERAANVAQRQIDASAGDVRVSWTMILEAISKIDRPKAP
jgi:hypothetical protein